MSRLWVERFLNWASGNAFAFGMHPELLTVHYYKVCNPVTNVSSTISQ